MTTSPENKMEYLIGATIINIDGAKVGSDEVSIYTDRGTLYLFHDQDCCELVDVEDITGDPTDLIGGVVSVAEERTQTPPKEGGRDDSETWTFYEIRTTCGDLTIRWRGSSNGYYSEEVETSWEPKV